MMQTEELIQDQDKIFRLQNNTLRLGKKNRISVDYGIKDIYKYWKDLNIEDSEKISYQLYRDILKEYNKKVYYNILYKSRVFKMPFKMGRIYIVKYKMDIEKLSNGAITKKGPRLRIDWFNTKKHNKKIYHLNEDRENFLYKIKWTGSTILNKRYYCYYATRTIKRTLASILKNNQRIDYLHV